MNQPESGQSLQQGEMIPRRGPEGVDCAIRTWREEDAADLAAALNNRHILDNLRDGLPYPYRPEDALDYIRAMLHADPDATFVRAITVRGRAVGSIGAFRQQNIHRYTAEMGYYLAEPFWGKGIGTWAVGEMCRQLFAATDIMRIFAEPFAHNRASCRILEKNGFVLEGTLRCNAVKNGRIVDMQMYSLIKKGN